MSDAKPAFTVDLGGLKTRSKDHSTSSLEQVDRAGEVHGFVDRSPRKKRGRPPSPRTGQVHAKVMPNISEAISAEARRRGVQQGILIEEAWAMYCEAHGLKP